MKDCANEDIAGTFYNQEVQAIDQNPNKIYKIERVVKRRKDINNLQEYFVKWQGWPDKFNSWIIKKIRTKHRLAHDRRGTQV